MTNVPAGTPAAEIDIDSGMVRRLLAAQHPDLAGLHIEPAESGWDNAMFRLGDTCAVRLPRRFAAVALLEREQRWLATLSRLPLPVPTPVRVGRAGEGYPWTWSVVPWLSGAPADLSPPDESQSEALAAFLAALHVAAPADAPRSSVRGVPLRERADVVERRLRHLQQRTSLVTPAVWQAWRQAVDAPREETPTWIHGDLHARNVLVEHGRISAVLDWGDMTPGDRATDLASIWMLLPSAASRARAMAAYPDTTEALWMRSRGWAITLGALLLETGIEDHPRHARMGELTLRRIAADL
jgi:aminoglycoside phosphotransferase (APT) family kinase protein